MSKREYAYSFDQETWKGSYSIPLKAYKEAQAELKAAGELDGTFYVGRFDFGPVPSVSANILIEDLQEIAQTPAFGGEYAEGWLDEVNELQKLDLVVAVNREVKKWIRKHDLQPTWRRLVDYDVYRVINGHAVAIEKGVEP